MNKPKHTSALARNSTEKIVLPSGRTAHIPKCETSFKPWRGKPIKDTFGNKALLTFTGKRLFAELVALRMLEQEGWHGVWVDSYFRKYRTGIPELTEPTSLPRRQEALLEKIRQKAGCRGGCFDVFAWRGKKYRFVELKRRGKDRIRPTQKRWLEAARHCGLKSSNFLIVEWDIA